MAAKKVSSRKPTIGIGPISDDLGRIIAKALSGAKGAAKKTQAKGMVKKLEKKNPVLRSPANNSIQKAKTTGSKLEHQLQRSRTKKADTALTKEMAKEHSAKMTAAGKNWDASANKNLARQAKTNARNRAENAKLAKESAKSTPAKVKSIQKQFNKMDIESKRGEGSFVSSSGKVKRVSPKRAAEGRRTAGAINSQLGKKGAANKQLLDALEKKIKNAKNAEQKLQARRRLRKFREDNGF